MKRKMFSILAIAAIALTSCKKEDPASSELGEATISGNIWSELDLTNATPESVEGMQVTIIVDTKDWDQSPDNSYNYEERVYTVMTDVNGDWTLTIPATEDGYNVDVDFEDLYGTRTLASSTENVEITNGSHNNQFIYAGAVINFNDEASVSSLNNNTSDEYGSATVYGKVNVNLWDASFWDGSVASNQVLNTASGLPTQSIVWYYGTAPYSSNSTDAHTVPMNADGTFEFTVPTEAITGNTIDINFGIMDFAATQNGNNDLGTADSTWTGIYTQFGPANVSLFDGLLSTNNDFTLFFQAF